MDSAVVVVCLPCPGGNNPLLRHQVPDLRDRTLSVRLCDTAGGLDQLPQLLDTQRPRAVVVSSSKVLRGRHLQRIAAAACKFCRTVTIVADDIDWRDTVALHIRGSVRSFTLLDQQSGTLGTRGGTLVVFGELPQLCSLTLTTDAHIHLSGQVRTVWAADVLADEMCWQMADGVVPTTPLPSLPPARRSCPAPSPASRAAP